MSFHVPAVPISACRIDHAVDSEDIPRNFLWSRKLEHSGAKLVIDQIVVLKLARWLRHTVAFEQVLDDFWPANIGHRNDLDVVIFQRKVIEVAADLSQTHNADPDFAVTHLAISLFPRLNSKEGLILDPLLLKKTKIFWNNLKTSEAISR
jgi:hypothetical protein